MCIQSVALVQASSSLSMGRTRAWLRTSTSTKFYFHYVFCGLFHTQATRDCQWESQGYCLVFMVPNINNACNILNVIKNLCRVDVTCQANADLGGTRPEPVVPGRVGNLLCIYNLVRIGHIYDRTNAYL